MRFWYVSRKQLAIIEQWASQAAMVGWTFEEKYWIIWVLQKYFKYYSYIAIGWICCALELLNGSVQQVLADKVDYYMHPVSTEKIYTIDFQRLY